MKINGWIFSCVPLAANCQNRSGRRLQVSLQSFSLRKNDSMSLFELVFMIPYYVRRRQAICPREHRKQAPMNGTNTLVSVFHAPPRHLSPLHKYLPPHLTSTISTRSSCPRCPPSLSQRHYLSFIPPSLSLSLSHLLSLQIVPVLVFLSLLNIPLPPSWLLHSRSMLHFTLHLRPRRRRLSPDQCQIPAARGR